MKWKSTKNHWTKIKTGKEKEDIIKKVSKGWSNLIFQKKDRVKCICQNINCKKEFEVKRSKIKNGRGKYCSKSCSAKSQIEEKSFHWKGGITTENHKIRDCIQYELWRNAIFARDNWMCQKYKIKGGILRAHHINNFSKYPELRFAIDNGVTLSEKAHREFHKKYGIKNNTKEQLKQFLLG
jgi:hypothetical protein